MINMVNKRSRLALRTKQRSQKTIILAGLGIIIILILLIKFGINLLVSFSVFISGNKNQPAANELFRQPFIAIPVLNPLPNATNSASIVVSGNSQTGLKIDLYVNNDLKDSVQADSNGIFLFFGNAFSGRQSN